MHCQKFAKTEYMHVVYSSGNQQFEGRKKIKINRSKIFVWALYLPKQQTQVKST